MPWPSLLDIRTRQRSLLAEATAALWADTELDRYANDAEWDVAIKTGCIENIDPVQTTSGSPFVAYSGLRVKYVEYVPGAGTPRGLVRIHPRQIGSLMTDAEPAYWFPWGRFVVIIPVPSQVYNLNLYVADYPAVLMSATTDTPEVPAEVQHMLVSGGVWRALLKPRKFGTSGQLYQTYVAEVQMARQRLVEREADRRVDLYIPDRIEIRQQR